MDLSNSGGDSGSSGGLGDGRSGSSVDYNYTLFNKVDAFHNITSL